MYKFKKKIKQNVEDRKKMVKWPLVLKKFHNKGYNILYIHI